VGTGRITLLLTDAADPPRYLDSPVFHYALEPDVPEQTQDLFPVSYLTANAFPAFVGVRHCAGFGLLYGTVLDCDGNQVDGASVTVSATSGTPDHLPGADTYYFSAQSTSLPVGHERAPNTNHDGMYGVAELPPTPTGFVQAWGYIEGQTPGVDPLTLLSEVPIVVAADNVANASLEPLRQ
jgi:hypothetical protein